MKTKQTRGQQQAGGVGKHGRNQQAEPARQRLMSQHGIDSNLQGQRHEQRNRSGKDAQAQNSGQMKPAVTG